MDDKITGSETSIGIADEIAKLKKLLDDGILTQDEYDQQKSRLLNNTPVSYTHLVPTITTWTFLSSSIS